MITIRRATIKDAELLARLCVPVQQIHYDARPDTFKTPAVTPDLVSDYQFRLTDDDTVCFIGEVEGEAVGSIVVQVVERQDNPYSYASKYLIVDQMSVNPEHRSNGYGESLMDAVFDLARSMQIKKVILNVWAFNQRAIEFYTRQGFAPRDIKMEAEVE